MDFKKSEVLVDEHVGSNASLLVAELLNHEEYQDKLYDILSQADYSTPAFELGYTVTKRNDGYWLINSDQDDDGSFLTERDAWEEACSLEGIEPFEDDAHEHWIVSEMLGHQLSLRGEMVIRFFGVTIWGRCSTGSAVYTDDVIVDIANNVII